jgi:DNA-binding CsgD family transcriptional regulator
MDTEEDPSWQMVQGLIDLPASAPSSVSDVLYLIACNHHDTISTDAIEQLNHAHLCFIRGNLTKALSLVEAVLNGSDLSQSAYRDITALRMFLQSMVGPDPHRWRKTFDQTLLAVPGAPRVVYLCIRSDRLWHSGQLFRGLRMNQYAVHQCRDAPILWRLYALLLLAKKLTDMHIRYQAHKLIAEIEHYVHNAGFHAFEAVAEALRSPLHLQAGSLSKALNSVAEAQRISEQRGSTIGVKLALSVAAATHLRLQEQDRARAYLKLFSTQETHYCLPDSVARAAFVEIALTAAEQGPRAAAEQIRASWRLLWTQSACFIEDTTRPAWLVAVARRAGDTALADCGLHAIEQLAQNNSEVHLLTTAAEYARTVYRGEDPGVRLTLDVDDGALSPMRNAHIPLAMPWGRRVPPAIPPTRPAPPDSPGPDGAASRLPGPEPTASTQSADLPALTARENEVAWLVARGMTNQQVANELGISPHTVNFHLRRIFRKFSISSRAQLAYLLTRPPNTRPFALLVRKTDDASRNAEGKDLGTQLVGIRVGDIFAL